MPKSAEDLAGWIEGIVTPIDDAAAASGWDRTPMRLVASVVGMLDVEFEVESPLALASTADRFRQMHSRTELIAGIGLAVAVGVFVSGCTAPRAATPLSTTTAAAPTTTDPATVGGSRIGPGPYRVEATVAVGENPRSVAIDPGAHKAYVAHYADSTR